MVKTGIRPGHVAENRIDIEKKLHQEFHSWFDKKYGRKKFEEAASFTFETKEVYRHVY